MAGFRLSDLNAVTSSVTTDLFHLRTVGGLDKKITHTNLFNNLPAITVTGQTILARDGGRLLVSGASDDGAFSTIINGDFKIEKDSDPHLVFRDIGTFVWTIGIKDSGDLVYTTGSITGTEMARLSSGGLFQTFGGFLADNGGADSPNMVFRSNGFNDVYVDSSSGELRFVQSGVGVMGYFNTDSTFLLNNHLLVNTTSDVATLHVDGTFRSSGTSGYLQTSPSGKDLQFSGAGANYIWATTATGYFAIGTNGAGISPANANLLCKADQSVTVNTTLLVNDGITLGDGTDADGPNMVFRCATGSFNIDTVSTGMRLFKTSPAIVSLIINNDETVTIGSTLYVDTIAEKTASAGITFNNKRKLKIDVSEGPSTSDLVFSTFSALVPTVGDFLQCEGVSRGVDSATGTVLGLYRVNADRINVNLCQPSGIIFPAVLRGDLVQPFGGLEIQSNYEVINI